jgi:uncharacterized protein (DUF433 family)
MRPWKENQLIQQEDYVASLQALVLAWEPDCRPALGRCDTSLYSYYTMGTPTTKQSVAFRFDPRTVKRLRQRARETHAPQTSLAERYIEEGLRQDEHPLVHFRDGENGRRPALLGTRLNVADVITTIRQNDNSVEETAEYLELPIEHVDACLRYYADYKNEIDAWIEHARAVAERERERWERRQQALM